MRLAFTTAAMLFLASAAFADEAAPPAPAPAPVVAAKKTPLRVVRVLEETHQALLFDKTKGTHVLVELGKEIDGFKVDDIDEDTVTLTPIEGGAQVVLAAPDPSWRRHREGEAPGSMKASVKPAAAIESAPMDPYAEDVRSAEAPDATTGMAPISAGEGGVRTAEAPGAAPTPVRAAEAPGAAPTTVRTAEAPGAAASPTVDTSSATAWDSGPKAPAVRTAEAPGSVPAADKAKIDRELSEAKVPFAWESAPAQPDAPIVLAKTDVSAALSNFSSLGVRGSFTPAGARLDAIAPSSLLAKAGLENGDVILSINNQPLKSIDDAANLYARAGSMRTANVQIQRAGKPMSLRLTIQ